MDELIALVVNRAAAVPLVVTVVMNRHPGPGMLWIPLIGFMEKKISSGGGETRRRGEGEGEGGSVSPRMFTHIVARLSCPIYPMRDDRLGWLLALPSDLAQHGKHRHERLLVRHTLRESHPDVLGELAELLVPDVEP